MNYPLIKLNKTENLLRPTHSSYSDEYAQRMCDLYLSDEIHMDEKNHPHKYYILASWLDSNGRVYDVGKALPATDGVTYTPSWQQTGQTTPPAMPDEVKVAPAAPAVVAADQNAPPDVQTATAALDDTAISGLQAVTANQTVEADGQETVVAVGTAGGETTTVPLDEVIEEASASDNYNTIIGTEGTPVVVVVPQLQIAVTEADISTNTITLQIKPVSQVVVTNSTTAVDAINSSNSIPVGEPAPLTVTTPVTITIPLPTGFTGETLQVKHVKSDERVFYYDATVNSSANLKTATFTVTNGFSTFTLQAADTRTLKMDFDSDVADKDYAITAVGSKLPVAVKSGHTFNGWRINGTVYTELTETLWKAIMDDATSPVAPGATSSAVEAKAQFSAIPSATTYTVTVAKAENGAVTAAPTTAKAGDAVKLTVKAAEGFVLDTITAKDADGKEVTLTKNADGSYSFAMPAANVTVTPAFKAGEDEETPWVNPFKDVPEGIWYYGAVQFVNQNNLFKGTADDMFSPDMAMTRGMIVTVIHRLEGEPKATAPAAFTDVVAGSYYAAAVDWAAEKGIVKGTTTTTFEPETAVNREQLATILYRYAEFKSYDLTATGDLTAFTDGADVQDFAKTAMQWAVGQGLLEGYKGLLTPQGEASRAQVATIMERFIKNIA